MGARKVVIVAVMGFYTILLCLALFLSSAAFWLRQPSNDGISSIRFELPESVKSGKDHSEPINRDNLLVFAFRINAISRSLNDAIKKSGLNLPPVKLYNSELSYKNPGRSWIAISDDFIVIFLFSDVANTLNANEVLAVTVHEIGHAVMGHTAPVSYYYRDIKKEVDADKFAVDSGVDPRFLISALNKLAPDDHEKQERITALSLYIPVS